MAKKSHKGENISSLNDLSEVNNYKGKRFGMTNLNLRIIRQSLEIEALGLYNSHIITKLIKYLETKIPSQFEEK